MLKAPVLIAGAGPVGMLSAVMLSHQGIPSIVVDRRVERLDAPKAHAVNPRTLEICAQLDISPAEIKAAGASASEGGAVHFVSSLTGTSFGSLPYERQDEAALEHTPYPLTNIAQPRFEEIVARRLEGCRDVTFLRGAELTDFTQDDTGVTASLTLRGQTSPVEVQADYLIAADGAGSRLRDKAGIELEGLRDLEHFVMLHFDADLTKLVNERPGVLYFLMGLDANGALISYRAQDCWVLMHPFDPATQKTEDFSDAVCKEIIAKALGTDVPEMTIRNVSRWSMCAEVAQSYRAGRLFLVGDAAHRFPPSGGLGLNTGVADAQNLAWKLARVIKGEAGDPLLDSYEAERRPVAQINSQQSLENASKLFDLVAALFGPDPEKVEVHYKERAAAPEAFPEIAAAVELQRPHFDSFNLQIGYRYASSALIDPVAPDADFVPETSLFEPTYEVGDRLPHSWTQLEGERVSLLDRLNPLGFTVLCGASVSEESVGSETDLCVLKAGRDFSDSDAWVVRSGLDTDTVLLVRPDGHIGAVTRLGQESLGRFCADAIATILKSGKANREAA